MNDLLESRRRFLGTSAAVLGAVSTGALGIAPSASAQTSPAPAALPEDATPGEDYWSAVRAQFSLPPGLTFLNNGTLGPVPRPVTAVRQQWDQALFVDPSNGSHQAEIDVVRAKLAALVNADADEIALTRSTTEGLNILARGLDLRPGDEVLLGTQEHRAGLDAYAEVARRFGVRLVTVPVAPRVSDPDEILQAYQRAITPRTRLLLVSQVSYLSGLLAPVAALAELAHRNGALISVDAAQSFGVLPVDLKASGVDHYAAPGHKWLLAGTGTGFAYFRKDLQDRVWPLFGTYDPQSKSPRDHTARRYEHSGQINVAAALGLGAAVDFHRRVGAGHIRHRVLALSSQLRQGLAKIGGVKQHTADDPALAAALTVFSLPGHDPEKTVKLLAETHKIQLRSLNTEDLAGIRVSTHFYNTPEEIDRLLAALRTLAG